MTPPASQEPRYSPNIWVGGIFGGIELALFLINRNNILALGICGMLLVTNGILVYGYQSATLHKQQEHP